MERNRVARFLLAGLAGFTADALLLSALVGGFDWSPYSARVLSVSIALIITWHLNRTLTFRDRSSERLGPEFGRYVLVQAGGVLVNYGAFSVFVTLSSHATRWPVLALVPAAAMAMGFTYVGMHYYAFPRTQLDAAHD